MSGSRELGIFDAVNQMTGVTARISALEQRLAAAEADVESVRDHWQRELAKAIETIALTGRERKAAEATMCAAMEGRSHAITRALQAEAVAAGLRLAGDTLMRLLRTRVDWDVEDSEGLPPGEHDERDVLEARITEQENALAAWRRAAAAGGAR